MNKSKYIIAVGILVIVAMGVGYMRLAPRPKQAESVATSTPTTVSTSTAQVQIASDTETKKLNSTPVPEGWKTYEDIGLGYAISYPPEWELTTPTRAPSPVTGREEQVIFKKDGTRILVDPLGRSGSSSETAGPVKTDILTINGRTWERMYYWPSTNPDNDRFTVQPGQIVLKEDPSTNGTSTLFGKKVPYTYRSDFRIHVQYEKDATQREKSEMLDMVIRIIGTLRII